MKTGKRIVSIFLVVLMLLTAAPLAGLVGLSFPLTNYASAAETYESGILKYTLNSNNKATITGTIYTKPEQLVGYLDIPATIDGYPVIAVGGFSGFKYLTGISIPDSVTSISDGAFYKCSGITTIDGMKNVTKIGDLAFGICTSLREIPIMNALKTIGGCAFYNTTSLTDIYIPETLTTVNASYSVVGIGMSEVTGKYGAFLGSGLKNVTFSPELKTIPIRLFFNCKSLEEVYIPDSVTTIHQAAFYKCTGLKRITGAKNVSTIKQLAFGYCTSLSSFPALHKLTTLEGAAFYYDAALTDFYIPSSLSKCGFDYNVVEIGTKNKAGIFAGSGLKNVTFDDSITTIPTALFLSCSSLERIELPNSVTSVKELAFYECTNLSAIEGFENIKSFGELSFYSCKGLTELLFGAQVKTIKSGAFALTTSVKVLYIPKSLTTVGTTYSISGVGSGTIYPFQKSGVEFVVIEDESNTIKNGMFYNCQSLKEITIPSSITVIENNAFYNCTELAVVYYGGSEEQWRGVSKESGNECLTNATIHFNSTGEEQPGEVPVEGVSLNTERLVLTMGTCESLNATITPANATNQSITWSSSDPTVATVDENGLIVTKREGITTIWAEVRDGNAFLFDSCKVIVRGPAYSLGEETYSFKNFPLKNQKVPCKCTGGHCGGMSATSSMYYLGLLDRTEVFGNNEPLYEKKMGEDINEETIKSICYYQHCQSLYVLKESKVAGGYLDTLGGRILSSLNLFQDSTSFDWPSVVHYVKNHNYDNKGNLLIRFWGRHTEGGDINGHGVNFLRYEVVNGEERIYAYDNNYPDIESYFYRDEEGVIHESPNCCFGFSIDGIGLFDTYRFFEAAKTQKTYPFIYSNEGVLAVENTTASIMLGEVDSGIRQVMYELPDDITQVRIAPLVDDAEFTYMDQTFHIHRENENTIGILTLAKTEEDTGILTVINDPDHHVHVYTGELTVEPTCSEPGKVICTCTRCDDTYTETIDAYGHYDNDDDNICDECGEPMPQHEHDYTATVTTPATCTEPGEATYTCDCGDAYTEIIPATGHVDDNNDGHCDRCGEQMKGGDHCKFCGKIHNGGFFDKLTGFFHKIFAIFKR